MEYLMEKEVFSDGTLNPLITVAQKRQRLYVCSVCRRWDLRLNVGQQQQQSSYVNGRQAGGQADVGREAAGGLCSCDHGGGCGAHQAASAAEALSRERQTHACSLARSGRRRRKTPTMKTVLSLHRKWAHAVKTIRILQGLVSAPPLTSTRVWAGFWRAGSACTSVLEIVEVDSVGEVKVLEFCFKVKRCWGLAGWKGIGLKKNACYWVGLDGKFYTLLKLTEVFKLSPLSVYFVFILFYFFFIVLFIIFVGSSGIFCTGL